MRHLLALALVFCGIAYGQQLRQQQVMLGLGASGPGVWTRVQTFATVRDGTNLSCGGTGCTLTGFTTLTSGNVVIVMFKGDNGNGAFLTGVSSGTWSTPAGCQETMGGWADFSCAYSLNAPAVSSLTLSFAAIPGGAGASAVLREYSYSGASTALDSGGTSCDVTDSSSGSHTGVTPTLAGNDVVEQFITLQGQAVTAVTIYGDLQIISSPSFTAEAVLENTSNTSPPVWTTGVAASIRCSLALKGL